MKDYLSMAFNDASKATRKIKTNPKVGAIIVKNGQIIGRGIHEVYGGPHAEINALRSVKDALDNAEMFVTLEPCSHHGKTPPCVDAIIASGIKKVTIGTVDPNPLVSGNGVRILQENGIEVVIKNDEENQKIINQDYLHWMKKRRPLISLKSGMSIDGKLALKNHDSKWITSSISRKKVQELRKNCDAIMVGVGTIIKDNPRLTVHESLEDSPIRIILDTHLKTPLESYIVQSAKLIPTWLFTTQNSFQVYQDLGVLVFKVPFKNNEMDLKSVFDEISNHPLKSVLVESGPTLSTALIKEGWIDEWHIFMAPKILGSDALSIVGPLDLEKLTSAIELTVDKVEPSGNDIYLRLVKERNL
jgi:diaminohydroxyphosphoribosylaminopyrimidine deaminase/5-amino-6-(5-phosphoribosylamino)uracil reductase